MATTWERWERCAYGIPAAVGVAGGAYVGGRFGGLISAGFGAVVGVALSLFVGVGAYLGGRWALALLGGIAARLWDRVLFAVSTTVGVWLFVVPGLLFIPSGMSGRELSMAVAFTGAPAFVCSALYAPQKVPRS
ncbi:MULTISPECIES: hypothetical protein [Nocardiaceae]|uniref:Uncharacterized protein n=1 Tax=Rhodococcoides corynebacterioides TaxID=53972 RepID=A0ABS2KUA5_9NOCA|nr:MULTISPECIES: hypothetical protein [Rhodococcus]MBM7415530.1 hypothetical protein [Rhodococcus corynebacterioides]MBP1117992.1 hypothetical protein [Rhodococcus sp. PvP016]